MLVQHLPGKSPTPVQVQHYTYLVKVQSQCWYNTYLVKVPSQYMYNTYLVEVPNQRSMGTTNWVVGLTFVVNIGSYVNVDTKLYVFLEST